MPRQSRLEIPYLLHHVIVRGIEKRDIFADDTDKERFIARLSDLLTKGSTKCFAWSLMTNHLHLLLMPTTVPLSDTMRRLLTSYAVYFNRKYQRSGHLFQNRYKSILCEEEPYFLELVCNIHLNPLRAGLVSDLESLERYPWSGHAVLLGNRTMEGQERDEVPARFGKSKARSLRGYRQFVADGLAAGHREDLIGGGLKRSQSGREEHGEIAAYDERILGSGQGKGFILLSCRARIRLYGERSRHGDRTRISRCFHCGAAGRGADEKRSGNTGENCSGVDNCKTVRTSR
jgi:putative transposase